MSGDTYKCASCINKPFSMIDFEKAIEKIKSLPPVAVEIEVYPQGLAVIKSNTTVLQNVTVEELACTNGIKIILVKETDDFNYNQGKVIYNDGSHKIIDIFKIS